MERVREWNRQAASRREAGNREGALAAAMQAAQVVREAPDGGVGMLAEGCAALHLSAELCLEAGDPQRAAGSAQEALLWARRWTEADPGSPPAMAARSDALNDLVSSRSRLGETPDALARKALEVAQGVVAEDRYSVAGRDRLCLALLNLADLQLTLGRPDQAELFLDAAREVVDDLAILDPPPAGSQPDPRQLVRLRSERLHGDLAAARGNPEVATGYYDPSRADALRRLDPGNGRAWFEVRRQHDSVIRAVAATGRSEARALWAAGQVGYPTDSPDDRHARLADRLRRRAWAERNGQLFGPEEEAEAPLAAARALWGQEGSPRAARLAADCCRAAASARLAAGQTDAGYRLAAEGIGWLDAARGEVGAAEAVEARWSRANLLTLRGDAAEAFGSPGGALRSYREAQELAPFSPGVHQGEEVARMALHRKLAVAMARSDDPAAQDEIDAAFRIALARAGRAGADLPDNRRELALCQEAQGDVDVTNGRFLDARGFYGLALTNLERGPESDRTPRERARILLRLGAADLLAGRVAEGEAAETHLNQALRAAEAISRPIGRRAQAEALDQLGHLALSRGRPAEGLPWFLMAREHRRALVTELGEDPQTLGELAGSHGLVGHAHLRLADAAIDAFRQVADRPGAAARYQARAECLAARVAFEDSLTLVGRQRQEMGERGITTDEVRARAAPLRRALAAVLQKLAVLGVM